MSNQNQNPNQNRTPNTNTNNPNQQQYQNQLEDEVDKALNELPKFVRLPQSDGETITVQFFRDETKRRVVSRSFKDPKTGVEREPTRRIEYKVILPTAADQGEKVLETPIMLARQIEENINMNHCLQKIIRHGTGLKTTYIAVSAS